MSDPTREALEAIRTFARHDESCDFTTGLRGVIASAPCSCGFDAAEDLYDAATAALSTTPAPEPRIDTERLAQTGVNVWGWDITRARQYAEQFAAEYARLEREGWYRGPEAEPFA